MIVEQYFWSKVFRCPTKRVRQLIRLEIRFRQPEVAQRDVPRGV